MILCTEEPYHQCGTLFSLPRREVACSLLVLYLLLRQPSVCIFLCVCMLYASQAFHPFRRANLLWESLPLGINNCASPWRQPMLGPLIAHRQSPLMMETSHWEHLPKSVCWSRSRRKTMGTELFPWLSKDSSLHLNNDANEKKFPISSNIVTMELCTLWSISSHSLF